MDKSNRVSFIPEANILFQGDFKSSVYAPLSLKNMGDERICYKVMVCMKQRYAIAPSGGFIEPYGTATIHITLKLPDARAKENFNTLKLEKHKLMVCHVAPPDNPNVECFDSVWDNVSAENVKKHRFRCVFRQGERLYEPPQPRISRRSRTSMIGLQLSPDSCDVSRCSSCNVSHAGSRNVSRSGSRNASRGGSFASPEFYSVENGPFGTESAWPEGGMESEERTTTGGRNSRIIAWTANAVPSPEQAMIDARRATVTSGTVKGAGTSNEWTTGKILPAAMPAGVIKRRTWPEATTSRDAGSAAVRVKEVATTTERVAVTAIEEESSQPDRATGVEGSTAEQRVLRTAAESTAASGLLSAPTETTTEGVSMPMGAAVKEATASETEVSTTSRETINSTATKESVTASEKATKEDAEKLSVEATESAARLAPVKVAASLEMEDTDAGGTDANLTEIMPSMRMVAAQEMTLPTKNSYVAETIGAEEFLPPTRKPKAHKSTQPAKVITKSKDLSTRNTAAKESALSVSDTDATSLTKLDESTPRTTKDPATEDVKQRMAKAATKESTVPSKDTVAVDTGVLEMTEAADIVAPTEKPMTLTESPKMDETDLQEWTVSVQFDESESEVLSRPPASPKLDEQDTSLIKTPSPGQSETLGVGMQSPSKSNHHHHPPPSSAPNDHDGDRDQCQPLSPQQNIAAAANQHQPTTSPPHEKTPVVVGAVTTTNTTSQKMLWSTELDDHLQQEEQLLTETSSSSEVREFADGLSTDIISGVDVTDTATEQLLALLDGDDLQRRKSSLSTTVIVEEDNPHGSVPTQDPPPIDVAAVGLGSRFSTKMYTLRINNGSPHSRSASPFGANLLSPPLVVSSSPVPSDVNLSLCVQGSHSHLHDDYDDYDDCLNIDNIDLAELQPPPQPQHRPLLRESPPSQLHEALSAAAAAPSSAADTNGENNVSGPATPEYSLSRTESEPVSSSRRGQPEIEYVMSTPRPMQLFNTLHIVRSGRNITYIDVDLLVSYIAVFIVGIFVGQHFL